MIFKSILSLAFACAFTSSTFAQQTITANLMSGGINRSYIIYIPANYTGATAVPLLFNFHGYTSNAQQQMFYGDFRPIADTAGFIIVHPEGTLDNSGTTHFNVGWGGSTADDVAFTSDMIDAMAAAYNINLERVYSTGMSNGGFMSFHLVCRLSDRIAAIGSVTGSITPATMTSCNATHPTPVLQIHGTSDGTVPYAGATGWSQPITSLVNFWANYNNCGAPSTINMPNTSTSDGSTVEKISYLGGDNCSEVVHYKITGGGHTWAGSAFPSSGTNYDINASKEVWNFVSRYDINGMINPCTANVEAVSSTVELTVYPNPARSEFSVKGLKQEVDFELISVIGACVQVGKISSTSNVISVDSLHRGVYFLKVDGKVLEVLVD